MDDVCPTFEKAWKTASIENFQTCYQIINSVWGIHANSKTRGVCHTVALPFNTLKCIFKAKVELWKFKYFTMQKCNLHKTPLKETKIHQDIIIL
jgi:hypothetical protein